MRCAVKISPAEIQTKAMKRKKTYLLGHLKFKTAAQTFNRDDGKALFNHSLLHVVSLRELGGKTNTKQH